MLLDRDKLDEVLRQAPLWCPCCHGEEWLPAVESAMLIKAGDLPADQPFVYINVFPVLCKRCGFVVFFDGKRYATVG